jgi:hypothetical protein
MGATSGLPTFQESFNAQRVGLNFLNKVRTPRYRQLRFNFRCLNGHIGLQCICASELAQNR